MKIQTAEECARAEAAVWKSLSAIKARQRWLHWISELDKLTCRGDPVAIRRAEKFRRIAADKTLEALEDFEKLKAWAEGCCDACE